MCGLGFLGIPMFILIIFMLLGLFVIYVWYFGRYPCRWIAGMLRGMLGREKPVEPD